MKCSKLYHLKADVAMVTSCIRSKFHIAESFPRNQTHCLTLVCKTEWDMKDYTLPSAVGFCWCWWGGGGRSFPSCRHPVVTLQPERYNIFPLHISQYDVSSNITQPLKTSSQLHITFNNRGGWLTVNHVFGFLRIPTQ